MKKSFLQHEKGSALIFTILILFILSVLGTVLISVAMTNFRLIRHGADYDSSYFLANGAAEEAFAEIVNLTENAEFEALSKMSEYANSIKNDYLTEITDDVTGETSYIVHNYKFAEFNDDINSHYSSLYLQYLIDYLETKIKSVEFVPADTIDQVNTEMTSPSSLDTSNLNDGTKIVIINSGKHSDIERKITLTFRINVPNYQFNTTNHGNYISYDGYDDKTNNGFDIINWQETNIN